jgi:two-component system sensor histidine kinase UhpB
MTIARTPGAVCGHRALLCWESMQTGPRIARSIGRPGSWRGRQGRTSEPPSLFWTLFIPNALVLAIAVAVLSVSPAHVPPPTSITSVVAVLAGLSALLVVDLLLMRWALRPLRRLTELMRAIDPLRPGRRVAGGGTREVLELAEAFNQMLDRIESERINYGRRTVAAQEDERLRVARLVHDEIGQTLTALMLQLTSAGRRAPADITPVLADATETTRSTLEGLHELVRQLRPEALDDLGLESAIVTLAHRVSERSGLDVGVEIDPGLPSLTDEQELVVYRVTQESLTNVMRHANASRVTISLAHGPGTVALRVRDDGQSMHGVRRQGGGIRGMRERAMLIGAALDIRDGPASGVEVRLSIPRPAP